MMKQAALLNTFVGVVGWRETQTISASQQMANLSKTCYVWYSEIVDFILLLLYVYPGRNKRRKRNISVLEK